MQPTSLVYSSHDRSNLIHDEWIVQRALRGNKRILFLPLSTPEDADDSTRNQQSAWDAFNWFFWYYGAYELDAFPFMVHSRLRPEDVDQLWHSLSTAEVVILGGGNPKLGMQRFRSLGERFGSEPGRFQRILHERKAAGLLTAGFSAGADQLCQLMSSASGLGVETPGLAIATRVIATSHFEPAQQAWVAELARAFPYCLTFGLPNDSALAVSEGRTAKGSIWQVIEVVIDDTWDRPSDEFHIKTRQGIPVFHVGSDGRQLGFRGGDKLVRIFEEQGAPGATFVALSHAPIFDYQTQTPVAFKTVEEILAAF